MVAPLWVCQSVSCNQQWRPRRTTAYRTYMAMAPTQFFVTDRNVTTWVAPRSVREARLKIHHGAPIVAMFNVVSSQWMTVACLLRLASSFVYHAMDGTRHRDLLIQWRVWSRPTDSASVRSTPSPPTNTSSCPQSFVAFNVWRHVECNKMASVDKWTDYCCLTALIYRGLHKQKHEDSRNFIGLNN